MASCGALAVQWPHMILNPHGAPRALDLGAGSWRSIELIFAKSVTLPPSTVSSFSRKVSSSESPHPERTDGVASFTCVLSVEVKTLNTYRKISRQIRPPIHPRPPPRPRPPDGAAPEAAPLVPACVS